MAPVQYIAPNGRVEFPKGPLALTGGDTPKWVDAWIVQSSTGSAQTYYGSVSSGAFAMANEWTANVRLYNRGSFQPGPAVGIVSSMSKTEATTSISGTEDPIELRLVS